MILIPMSAQKNHQPLVFFTVSTHGNNIVNHAIEAMIRTANEHAVAECAQLGAVSQRMYLLTKNKAS